MKIFDIFSIGIALLAVVWMLRGVGRWLRRGLYRIKGIFPRSLDFALRDVPLSREQWQRFCSLAHARGVSQKRLLADMVVFYFEKNVR